ncbi:MAG TPA: alpha-L-fucosidase, partial [Cytophagaceae bacterium]
MKFKLIAALFIVLRFTVQGISQNTTTSEKLNRTQWFREARFGMFIHFGIYSIHGRGEWVRSVEKISNEEYQPYVESFNPT